MAVAEALWAVGTLLILINHQSYGATSTPYYATYTSDNPKTEFRGLWLATVANIDWPPAHEYNTTVQRADLLKYLDAMAESNLNAVFFQVRSHSDALYHSTIEPWSKLLTGTQGIAPDPYYDPLQFLLDEACSRSIEVHAWLNPYIANSPPTTEGLAPNHIARRYPQYAYRYGPFLWMDPGADVVIDNLRKVVADILQRYPVHGIHFDDFFYPYPSNGREFPDNATYQRYKNSGGKMSRDDWRRDNVNMLVKSVYSDIHAFDPNKKFSISPFGLYKPGEPGGMPAPIKGLDPYSATFADSKLWLQSGWVDALIPQLYWSIECAHQSYPQILDWWLNVNNASRQIYAGNAAYRITTSEGNWNISELLHQVRISRQPRQRKRYSLGNVWFSAKFFKENYKRISDIFVKSIYSTPANSPDFSLL